MTDAQTRWTQVRAQFDALPFPHAPLDQRPADNPSYLALHSTVGPYYLRDRQIVDTSDQRILDAGCGSGIKLMALAAANPGAHLVGIDLSQKSVDLARQRLEYHGISNPVEFHCLSIEDLPKLGYCFDYINCDEVLYSLSNPADGLAAMGAVLKPKGIIRGNLHSAFQRADYYRMQAFLDRLGFRMDRDIQEEVSSLRQIVASLHDWVITKQQTWKPHYHTQDESILMNYLLRGDTGFTMMDLKHLLETANLSLINMVNWREWNLENLFKSIEELPIAIALQIAEMSYLEQLHLYELLHPTHRLLDFYCGHSGVERSHPTPEDWTDGQWQTAIVHLHPQLQTPAFQAGLRCAAETLSPIHIEQFLKINGIQSYVVDSAWASCLYPLVESPQVVESLVRRWLAVRPLDSVTLQPTSPVQAFAKVRQFLTLLEREGYLMIELA